ncbi:ABC transporter permease (plasmid) [Nitrobacteraceae bacterium UC4446_H13]
MGVVSRLRLRGIAAAVSRYVATGVGVAVVVSTLAFIATQSMQGDTAMRVAEARYGDGVSFALADDIRQRAGLDQPVHVQYVKWIASIATGNLGRSTVSERPVVEELQRGLVPTITIIVVGMPIAFLCSLLIGSLAGIYRGGLIDRAMLALAALITSIPAFLIGVFLVTVFAIKLDWFPVAGITHPLYYVLPALTLAITLLPDLSRIVRNAVGRALQDFYVTYGRVKGQSWSRIAFAHVMRPTLVPIIAYFGQSIAHMIGGMIIIDVLFNLGGIGSILIDSILASDIPVALGAGLLIGLFVVAVNGLTDLAVTLLDPREVSFERNDR